MRCYTFQVFIKALTDNSVKIVRYSDRKGLQ
uniref:Uncharacterized protein n=1 Tax=Anguilla anguilla TaxID=7936 RepID=A0A0E9TNS3_ANGAN